MDDTLLINKTLHVLRNELFQLFRINSILAETKVEFILAPHTNPSGKNAVCFHSLSAWIFILKRNAQFLKILELPKAEVQKICRVDSQFRQCFTLITLFLLLRLQPSIHCWFWTLQLFSSYQFGNYLNFKICIFGFKCSNLVVGSNPFFGTAVTQSIKIKVKEILYNFYLNPRFPSPLPFLGIVLKMGVCVYLCLSVVLLSHFMCVMSLNFAVFLNENFYRKKHT